VIACIKEWLDQRSGRTQAEHEIQLLKFGSYDAAALRSTPDPRLQASGGRNPFARAYAGRWYDEGYADAKSGRCHSQKFQSTDYDFGWIDCIKKLRQQGFQHDALADQYEQLVLTRIEKDLWASFGVRTTSK